MNDVCTFSTHSSSILDLHVPSLGSACEERHFMVNDLAHFSGPISVTSV